MRTSGNVAMNGVQEFLEALKRVCETDAGSTILAFLTSSLAGLAELLRSDRAITARAVAAATLHAGLWGIAIVGITYHRWTDSIWTLIGFCILSGIGGATVTDFVVSAIKRGLGINVRIDTGEYHGPDRRIRGRRT